MTEVKCSYSQAKIFPYHIGNLHRILTYLRGCLAGKFQPRTAEFSLLVRGVGQAERGQGWKEFLFFVSSFNKYIKEKIFMSNF